jgi:hypothetical protein
VYTHAKDLSNSDTINYKFNTITIKPKQYTYICQTTILLPIDPDSFLGSEDPEITLKYDLLQKDVTDIHSY